MPETVTCARCDSEVGPDPYCGNCGWPRSDPRNNATPDAGGPGRAKSEGYRATMALIEAIAACDDDRAAALTQTLTQRGNMPDILEALTTFGGSLKRFQDPVAVSSAVTAALDSVVVGTDQQKAAAMQLGRAALIDADPKTVVRVALAQRSAPTISDAQQVANLLVVIHAAGRVASALRPPTSGPPPLPLATPAAIQSPAPAATRHPTPRPTPRPAGQARPPSQPPRPAVSPRPRVRKRKALSPVKNLIAIAFLGILVGGWIYGHSTTFRVECTAQKLGIAQLPFPKNIICDVDFDLNS